MQPALDDIAEQAAVEAMEHIFVAVFVLDRDGRVTYLNPAAEKLTGRKRDAAVGKAVFATELRQPACLEALVAVQDEDWEQTADLGAH